MQEDLRSEMRDELQALRRCRDACERWIDPRGPLGESGELPARVRELLTETTQALERTTSEHTHPRKDEGPADQPRKRSRWRRLRWSTVGWWFLYTMTVATLVMWYQVWPAWKVSRQLQGSWQYTAGFGGDEQLEETFFHVNGRDTWLAYPFRDQWQAQRSRIRIRPANDFFIVRREYGFHTVNTRETEYIVRCVNGNLYRIRGMARLDAMRERKIEKLRRIQQLPAGAADAIEAATP